MRKKVLLVLILVLPVLVSGCTDNRGEDKTSLKITDFSYASSINGLNDYVSHSSSYGPNNEVLMYFEVPGIEKSDGNAQVKQDLIVTGPQGQTVLNTTVLNSALEIPEGGTLWLRNVVTPPNDGFPSGTYQIKIKLKDKVAQETITFQDSFQINQ